jgi:hypothetical protein
MRIMGVAEGVIMATIMTAHMMKVRIMSPMRQVCVLGMDIFMLLISIPAMLEAR